MNADSFKQSDLPKGDLDAELDLLLSEAKWPEADAETLMRLSALTTTAMQESGENLATTVKPLIEVKSQQPKRWLVICVSIAGMILAFLAGRWTTPSDRQNDIVAKPQELNPTKVTETTLLPEQMAPSGDTEDKKSVTPFMSDTSKEALANNQSGKLTPSADPVSAKHKRLSQRDKMKQQLDSVLACLEEGQKAETCCQTLLPRKAQFEYLLKEIVRTATGQRQTAAIAAMGFIGSDGTVPLLLEIAEKPDLRTNAVQSVKRVSSEQMLAALVVRGGDVATRKELLIELAHRKTPQAAFIWLHLVRTPDCRDLCLQVVDELSPELVDLLFAELDAPVIDDRIAAIQSLGRRVDEPTFRRTELLCQNFPHRWEPVAILMWNGSETAMGFLARLKKNPERYAVIQTAVIQLKTATGAGSGSQ
jgi:hypothetical protein